MDNLKKGMRLMLVFSLLDSSAGLLIKLLSWNAFAIAGVRGLITAAVLYFWYRRHGVAFVCSLKVLGGGAVISLMFFTFIAAVRLTSAAGAALLQYTSPVFIMLFSFLLYRQKPSRRELLAVCIVLVGVFLCFLNSFSFKNLLGSLLAIISGAAFAGMFLFNHHVKTQQESLSGLVFGHLLTFVVSIPFLILFPVQMDAKNLTVLLALAVFQQAIPHILYAKAIRLCSALVCSLVTMLGPVINAALVYLFLGEKPGAGVIIGGALILLSIGGFNLGKKDGTDSGR